MYFGKVSRMYDRSRYVTALCSLEICVDPNLVCLALGLICIMSIAEPFTLVFIPRRFPNLGVLDLVAIVIDTYTPTHART